jgi:hypothetical protein
MSTTQTVQEKKLWVLVSSLKENSSDANLERIAPAMSGLIDQWHSQGKFVWSGPLNEKSGMAIFEATEQDANQFFEQNKKICSDALDSYLYQWGALPFLSLL